MAGKKTGIDWQGKISNEMVEVLLRPHHTRRILAALEKRDPAPYTNGDLKRLIRTQTNEPKVSIMHNLRSLRERGFLATGYNLCLTERGRELMTYINEMEKREEENTDK